MKTIISILAITLFLSGCGVHQQVATNSYDDVRDRVNLGDSKQEVLALLMPDYHLAMKVRYLTDPEKDDSEGSVVDIYYMRPARNADILTTDDAVTPYMFVDDKLTGIGEAAIDGPKTQANSY